MFKGIKNGVQEVAVKVLINSDEIQVQMFQEVRPSPSILQPKWQSNAILPGIESNSNMFNQENGLLYTPCLSFALQAFELLALKEQLLLLLLLFFQVTVFFGMCAAQLHL